MAIVAPAGWPAHERLPVQRQGTRLLAYVGVLETPLAGPPPAHVLWADGRPLQNPAWSTWVLDPRHPLTRQHLLEQAAELRAGGWDGVFLDTLAAVESPDLPRRLQGELLAATARLIQALAVAWPEGVRVANWGFGPLLPLSAPWIHGLCWEAFPYEALASGRASADLDLALRLKRWAGSAGLALLALNERPPDPVLARETARRHGFVWYGAPGRYIDPPGETFPDDPGQRGGNGPCGS